MKTLTASLFFFLLIPFAVTAQSKQKAEKEFLKKLNTILKDSKEEHWRYKGEMTIDSAFAINKNGFLSVTVRYTNEEGDFITTRMEAPVKNIKQLAYDLYLILEYKEEEVTIFESEKNSVALQELQKSNYFHIGAPPTKGYKQQEKLQQLLEKVLLYYKK